MVVEAQRDARQQIHAVQAMIGFVGRCAERDASAQDFAADRVLEDQTDVGGRGLAHTAVVAGAIHAEAIIADAARAVTAAGLRIEADLVAVRAEHHDLQRIEQGALAGAVGRNDRGGRIQFQRFGLEQEELDQMRALKLIHRRCPCRCRPRRC